MSEFGSLSGHTFYAPMSTDILWPLPVGDANVGFSEYENFNDFAYCDFFSNGLLIPADVLQGPESIPQTEACTASLENPMAKKMKSLDDVSNRKANILLYELAVNNIEPEFGSTTNDTFHDTWEPYRFCDDIGAIQIATPNRLTMEEDELQLIGPQLIECEYPKFVCSQDDIYQAASEISDSLHFREMDKDQPVLHLPGSKRLVRQPELMATQGTDAVASSSRNSSESNLSMEPASSEVARPLSCNVANEVLRYATVVEIKLLIAAIKADQKEARKALVRGKPENSGDCVFEKGWKPYKCFICPLQFPQNSEIVKHLKEKHAILLSPKLKAWACLFPGCRKAYCLRKAALIHAECHFTEV
ncbi:uncharacterized protein RAG0_12037 [Rhynchosporium agropyri]|uniref:C2H2-type domain-containing protein n=1 Tax=Rhynchosporium agropyri TaxID=914238 RepID=A0A1E1L753_9HELO|nr:uncharacterized protein RAG0_12037 [Rhynchosporium agropyri]